MTSIKEQAQESLEIVKEKVGKIISDITLFKNQQEELTKSLNVKIKHFVSHQKVIVNSLADALNDQKFKNKVQKLIVDFEKELKKKITEISSQILKAQKEIKVDKKAPSKSKPSVKKTTNTAGTIKKASSSRKKTSKKS